MSTSTLNSSDSSPIRVVVVDDSATIRKLLTDILSSDPDIEVVGTAPDPYAARHQIKLLDPDVITLDVEMPKMDGLQFLKNIMRLRPMPVIMVSSLTEKGADITLRALHMGAVDAVCKPDNYSAIGSFSEEVIQKVKIASVARITRLITNRELKPQPSLTVEHAAIKAWLADNQQASDTIVAIGASTGGVEAVSEVVTNLPPETPGILVVQHIPDTFSAPFAERLNTLSAVSVSEARDGEEIMRSHVYIAPGDKHLTVTRHSGRHFCRLSDAERVNRHRPSVDVLFHSVAKRVGPHAVGVMLTGMGRDGAEGMRAMKLAGAATIAQDEESSVVWGMPGAAIKAGAVDIVLPLEKIAEQIMLCCESLLANT